MDLGRQGIEARGCQNGRMTHTIFLISFFFLIYLKPKEIKQGDKKGDHWLALGDVRIKRQKGKSRAWMPAGEVGDDGQREG